MGRGWIKLHRKLRECDLWNCEPFSRGQAWVDILLMVNHDDKKVVLGSQVVEIKRGQTITSIRKLSEKWHWGNKKTISFLGQLEKLKMIDKESDTKKTLLTVINYDDYQLQGNTEGHTNDNTDDHTDDHTDDTQTRNIRINKNEKEIYIPKSEQKKNNPEKHKYGEYNHVLLTDEQYSKLIDDYGNKAVEDGIRKVDEYCQEHGKKYKDYNLTLRKWGIKAQKIIKEKEEPKKEEPKVNVDEMTDEEWEAYVQSEEWEKN